MSSSLFVLTEVAKMADLVEQDVPTEIDYIIRYYNTDAALAVRRFNYKGRDVAFKISVYDLSIDPFQRVIQVTVIDIINLIAVDNGIAYQLVASVAFYVLTKYRLRYFNRDLEFSYKKMALLLAAGDPTFTPAEKYTKRGLSPLHSSSVYFLKRYYFPRNAHNMGDFVYTQLFDAIYRNLKAIGMELTEINPDSFEKTQIIPQEQEIINAIGTFNSSKTGGKTTYKEVAVAAMSIFTSVEVFIWDAVIIDNSPEHLAFVMACGDDSIVIDYSGDDHEAYQFEVCKWSTQRRMALLNFLKNWKCIKQGIPLEHPEIPFI